MTIDASPSKSRKFFKADKQDRAKSMMTAALKLFSQHDYSAVTIKQIANEAGVNAALLYYYFDNKQALFSATMEATIADFLRQYEMLKNRHSNPVDLINDWFEIHATSYQPIQQLMKIMFDYSSSNTQMELIDNAIKAFYEEEKNLLSNAIRKGIEQGSFKDIDPYDAAEFASTYLDGLLVRKIIIKDIDIHRSIESLRHVFWLYVGYNSTE